jgi:carboxypeptidase family protein
MSATILVFDHHLYTTPAADGSFTVDAVPPGTYQLSAWHERIGETTKPLKIVAGDDASVEFALPVVEK